MTERVRHCFYLQGEGFLASPEPAVESEFQLATVPEWVNIMPAPDGDGVIHSRDFRSLRNVDLKKLAAASNAELKRQRGGGPVDADHTLYGGFFVAGGGPVLGWAEEFEAREDGLYARTEWLPEGRELIKKKRYRYTSSVLDGEHEWEFDEEGWPVRLWIEPALVEGFGITNIPALKTTAMFTHQGDDAMKIETMRVALTQLGLGEDASASDIKAAFGRLKRFTADTPTPTPADSDDEEVKGEQDAVEDEAMVADEAASPATLRKRLAAAKARVVELEQEQVEATLAALSREGKLTPAQRKAAAALASKPGGLADLKALFAAAPPVLNAERPPALVTTSDTDKPPHGVSPEAWRRAADKSVPLHELARQIHADRTQETKTT